MWRPGFVANGPPRHPSDASIAPRSWPHLRIDRTIGRVGHVRLPGEPRSELHDRLLVHVVTLDLAGNSALVQHQYAIADADQLRQFRRDRDDTDALAGEVAQDRVDLCLGAD